MNSIHFHNAIVSLLRGVLDEEEPSAKPIPSFSQTGGAPAIEAVDEMFKGGSIETQTNDRYIEEIDDPDDIKVTGGAFDDKSSSSEDSEANNKSSSSSSEDSEPQNDEKEINRAEPVDSDDGDIDGKVEVAKDGDGDAIENEDNIDEGTDDGERAGDEDNKEKDKKKIQIPEVSKQPLEESSEDSEANKSDTTSSEDSEEEKIPTNNEEVMLTGGTAIAHHTIVVTADTKFPYIIRQKRKL